MILNIIEFKGVKGQSMHGHTLLEKAKLAREISDGKNKIPHKFLGRKI